MLASFTPEQQAGLGKEAIDAYLSDTNNPLLQAAQRVEQDSVNALIEQRKAAEYQSPRPAEFLNMHPAGSNIYENPKQQSSQKDPLRERIILRGRPVGLSRQSGSYPGDNRPSNTPESRHSPSRPGEGRVRRFVPVIQSAFGG